MKLEALFEQTHRLPTVPQVVQQLIDSFNQPDADLTGIAAHIAQDPVIAAKTLRLANCAHTGATRRIGSINEAVMVLGFSTMRTLVIATGITGAFITTPGFDRKRFWQHSLDVAACARWLAAQTGQDTDSAFTNGLLHSIGELLIHVVAPELAPRIEQHDPAIGFDYAEVGAELARRWNFPETFRLAILHQNAPLQYPESGMPGLIMHLAITLANALDAGTPPDALAAALPQEELTALGFDLATIAGELPAAIRTGKLLDALATLQFQTKISYKSIT